MGLFDERGTLTKDEEKSFLEQEKKHLQNQLGVVLERLQALEEKKGKE